MKTEKEKMLAGEPFRIDDPELAADRDRASRLLHAINTSPDFKSDSYRALLRELLPGMDDEVFIRAPFRCDYGYTIRIGKGCFFNWDCTLLDQSHIAIGERCLFGPGVKLCAATHPLDAVERTEVEWGEPITIGNDCWFGAGAIVCPGVRIGNRVIVGAGSVVTRHLPDDCVAAGNPARIIRSLK